MRKKELVKRYIFFIIGLFINALGITLITKAQLGTSPISSVPYTFSKGFPLTMGTFTFILNIILIFGQIIIQKKEFSKMQLIQIPISVIFGYFIDLNMALLSSLNPEQYLLKILFVLMGSTTLALGISIEVIANVVMLSGEAFVKAVSDKFNKEFGTIKVSFDITLVTISSIISLFMFHKLVGVREGTIIAALIVGLIAKIFSSKLRFINNKFLLDKKIIKGEEEQEEQEIMVS